MKRRHFLAMFAALFVPVKKKPSAARLRCRLIVDDTSIRASLQNIERMQMSYFMRLVRENMRIEKA